MKLAIFLALLLFVGLASSTSYILGHPINPFDGLFLLSNCLKVHSSQNDIVDIFTPDKGEGPFDFNHDLFFVEKDLATGEDKGLFKRTESGVTKLLNSGRDIAADANNDKKIYFAASDGIYIYNSNLNKADKYGTVTDDLISIAVESTGDVIYVLTKNKELFKVTNNGSEKVKINEVSNVEHIVVDNKNNLYFRTTEKDVYIMNEGGVKKVEGLRKNPSTLILLRPPYQLDSGVPAVVNKVLREIYANGTNELTTYEFDLKPTAYSFQKTITHYFAVNKEIYACSRSLKCDYTDPPDCHYSYSHDYI